MSARDSSTSAQRICPKCGHANSNISLFCAECGAVLNGASTGDTGAYAPMTSDATNTQQTQPVSGGTGSGSGSAEQEWASLMASSNDDAQQTAPLPKSTPPVSTVTAPAAASNMRDESPSTSASTAWPPAAANEQPASAPVAGESGPYSTGVSFGMEPRARGMRGFWFGVVGIVLILLVLGLYGWSIMPDGGFRDTVQGWF